jgi:hypothetical protein
VSWYPSGLEPLVIRLATAAEGRFSKITPDRPARDLKVDAVANLPPAASWEGCTIYVRDVDGAGASCPVFSDGTNWRRYDTRGSV